MTPTNSQRTLSQRLTEGRIPVAEALHYAMSLADSLRKIHDAGRFHGAVSPAHIALTATGLDLIPMSDSSIAASPYTAPEVVQGGAPDARSDIFGFGTTVFEMLTGRRAFDSEGQSELTAASSNSAPPLSGSPAVDRLVAGCVAKDPAARWHRMQKIILELKLLTVAARRADATRPARGAVEAALRSEMQEMAARLTARLAAHERAVSESQQAAGDAMKALLEQLATVAGQLAAVQAIPPPIPVDTDALMRQIEARVNQTVEAVRGQLTAMVDEKAAAGRQHVEDSLAAAAQHGAVRMSEAIADAGRQHGAHVDEKIGTVVERMAVVEQGIEEIRKQFAGLQAGVDGDLRDLEQKLKTQTAAIDSARTAMTQTDDLVERVVEALELLQSSLLDQHEAVVN